MKSGSQPLALISTQLVEALNACQTCSWHEEVCRARKPRGGSIQPDTDAHHTYSSRDTSAALARSLPGCDACVCELRPTVDMFRPHLACLPGSSRQLFPTIPTLIAKLAVPASTLSTLNVRRCYSSLDYLRAQLSHVTPPPSDHSVDRRFCI